MYDKKRISFSWLPDKEKYFCMFHQGYKQPRWGAIVASKTRFSFSTLVLPKGGAGVAETGTIRGGHLNVICLATDQVTQSAVRGGAAAGDCRAVADSLYIVAHCVSGVGPEHLSCSITAHHQACHVRWRAWLWRVKQKQLELSSKGVILK